MPRIRSIHPEICESEQLADVSARAERTYTRLWTHLDDEGRGRDRPKLLAAKLFPYHDDMDGRAVDEDLDALAAAGLLVRYEVDGVRYLAVRGAWDRWQQPSAPRPSAFPPPPGTVTDPAVQMTGEVLRARRSAQGLTLRSLADLVEVDPSHLSRAERGQVSLSYDLRSRLTDHLPAVDRPLTDVDTVDATEVNGHGVLTSVVPEGEREKEGEVEWEEDHAPPAGDTSPPPDAPDPVDESFDQFWDAFPRGRAGKPGGDGPRKKARARWGRMTQAQRDAALAAVDNYREHVEAPDGPYACHAVTWLNQDRWEQWQTPAEPRAGPRTSVTHVDQHRTGSF